MPNIVFPGRCCILNLQWIDQPILNDEKIDFLGAQKSAFAEQWRYE